MRLNMSKSTETRYWPVRARPLPKDSDLASLLVRVESLYIEAEETEDGITMRNNIEQ